MHILHCLLPELPPQCIHYPQNAYISIVFDEKYPLTAYIILDLELKYPLIAYIILGLKFKYPLIAYIILGLKFKYRLKFTLRSVESTKYFQT